jgi:hypothetical protein
MIPFTFSKNIELVVTDGAVEDVKSEILSAISQQLEAKQPSMLTKRKSQIVFSGGAFRVPDPRRNILAPIQYGTIEVINHRGGIRVSYNLSYTELLLMSAVMSLIISVVVFWKGFVLEDLWIPFLALGVFYLGNYLVSIIRFDVFIYSVLNKLHTIMYK